MRTKLDFQASHLYDYLRHINSVECDYKLTIKSGNTVYILLSNLFLFYNFFMN